MRTDAQRIARYDDKSNPVTVAPIVTAQLPTMKSNFSGKAQSLADIEISIQNSLNAAGLPTIQYPFYLNFGREMWALGVRGVSGTSYIQMCQSLKEKYLRYGLAEPNLIQFAADWFQVTLT